MPINNNLSIIGGFGTLLFGSRTHHFVILFCEFWEEIKTLNMGETMVEEDVVGTVGTIYEMVDGGMIYVPEVVV